MPPHICLLGSGDLFLKAVSCLGQPVDQARGRGWWSQAGQHGNF